MQNPGRTVVRPSMARALRRRLVRSRTQAMASLVACAAALAVFPAHAADDDLRPRDRADATSIVANARRIATPDGVDTLEQVRIGGIDQWVSVRGVDRRNPVLLYIHGGPGYPSIPASWWTTQGWPEYFTVVQWDQRATGKTHRPSAAGTIPTTLDADRMIGDAEDMAAWARRTFGKRRIFVLGHSYGSYLGIELAVRHPDWLHAYIGVGQLTDVLEGERRSWRFALDAARRAGQADAIRDLLSIAPYAAPGKPPTTAQLLVERKWMAHFGGAMAYRHDNTADVDLGYLSPDETDDDVRHLGDGGDFSVPIAQLLGAGRVAPDRLEVPLVLLNGRYDRNVDASTSADWFARVRAPSKRLVWFEHSAHMMMTEEPGKFLVTLVRYARPFAERAGDVPH